VFSISYKHLFKQNPTKSDKIAMNKTEAFLQIIMLIMHSPRRVVSKSELEERLQKPYSTFQRWLAELREKYIIDGHPIVLEIMDGDEKAYTLNNNMFKYFYPSHLETAYYFEAYQKLGSLLDHKNLEEDVNELKEEVFNLNGRGEQMKRKFYYLSKTKSSNEIIDLQHQGLIVQALIENKILNLKYNNKDYEVLPLCICQYRDALYLIGYKEAAHDDNIRKFKFKRMDHIEITDEIFEYPKPNEWNPETYFQGSSGLITGEIQKTIIRVYGDSRLHISERDFFESEPTGQTKDYDEYELHFTNVDEFLGQLFVYAQDIEIVDNQKLKEAFNTKAQSAIDKNPIKKAA
jgi:predicted DNA-binding transcriptional regulator YafY